MLLESLEYKVWKRVAMLLESLEYKVWSMEKSVLYVVGRTGLEPVTLAL